MLTDTEKQHAAAGKISSMEVKSSRVETFIGFFVLLVLAGIATWVYFRQFQFDPAIITPTVVKGGSIAALPPGAPAASDFLSYLPDGMKPLSPMEAFGSESLSEKIDGKAELYLSSGFVNLRCQRFVKGKESNSWMELFVFDMGSVRNAFSVFSVQRREDAEQIPLTPFAYRTRNALFFVHGRDYVEIIGSNENMFEEMLSVGKNFVGQGVAKSDEVGELALFPRENLDEGSILLLSKDAFGFQGLDNVFTGTYALEGATMTLFLSLRKTPQEAEDLAASYNRFLLENGGVARQPSEGGGQTRIVEIMDSFEIIFTRGSLLAGVHEAESRDLAAKLVAALQKKLDEVGK